MRSPWVGASLRLAPDATGLDVANRLHIQHRQHLGNVPRSGPLDFRQLLGQTSVQSVEKVLVNWYRFDEIDRIDIDVLSQFFDDIWYPAVDDIEIFDTSCGWFISVSHDGRVELISLQQARL
jgi:hypothetical protein